MSGRGLSNNALATRSTPPGVFTSSRLKAFRKAGKAAKQSWFRARLQDLQTSAASRDSRALYAGVRTLAPKSQRIKVQLRDGDGQIQDPEVQLQQLMQHYKKLYAADEDREIV